MRPPLCLPDKQERERDMAKNDIEFCNAVITEAFIKFNDQRELELRLCFEGKLDEEDFKTIITYPIGWGFIGSNTFAGRERGICKIMKIMDVTDASNWESVRGRAVRIIKHRAEGQPLMICHITKDKWFILDDWQERKRK